MNLDEFGNKKAAPRGKVGSTGKKGFQPGNKFGRGSVPGQRKIKASVRQLQAENAIEVCGLITRMMNMSPQKLNELIRTKPTNVNIILIRVFRMAQEGIQWAVEFLFQWYCGNLTKIIELNIEEQNHMNNLSPEEKKEFLSNPANIRRLSEIQREIKRLKK